MDGNKCRDLELDALFACGCCSLHGPTWGCRMRKGGQVLFVVGPLHGHVCNGQVCGCGNKWQALALVGPLRVCLQWSSGRKWSVIDTVCGACRLLACAIPRGQCTMQLPVRARATPLLPHGRNCYKKQSATAEALQRAELLRPEALQKAE